MIPDVSVIMVNFRREALVRRALSAFYGSAPGFPVEFVIVDNAPTNGALKELARHFPVRLIENQSNVGFAKAVNQTLLHCSGKYLLLLNPDAFLTQGGLAEMVHFMEGHPRAGACVPQLKDAAGAVQTSCSFFPTLPRQLFLLSGLKRHLPRRLVNRFAWRQKGLEPQEVDWAIGACLLLRREALKEIGGKLDDFFFVEGEDLDLCYRLKEKDWKVFYLPAVEAIHLSCHGENPAWESAKPLLYRRALLHFFRTHYGRPKALALRILQGLFPQR